MNDEIFKMSDCDYSVSTSTTPKRAFLLSLTGTSISQQSIFENPHLGDRREGQATIETLRNIENLQTVLSPALFKINTPRPSKDD